MRPSLSPDTAPHTGKKSCPLEWALSFSCELLIVQLHSGIPDHGAVEPWLIVASQQLKRTHDPKNMQCDRATNMLQKLHQEM